MDGLSFRNVWVSLAIMLPFGVVGLFLLRDDPVAKGWLVLGLLFCGISLRHFLDRNEDWDSEDD